MKAKLRLIMRVMIQCSPDYDMDPLFATVDVEVDVPEHMLTTYKQKMTLPAVMGGEWLAETEEAQKG